MALKKSQLYSSLWQSCDELRGGMDASQYKDYVRAGRLQRRARRPAAGESHHHQVRGVQVVRAAGRGHLRRVAQHSRAAPLGIAVNALPKTVIRTLSEDLLARFADLALLDRYDVYQRLMDYWDAVMQDDVYLIAVAGWAEAAKPRGIIEDKEKKIKETADLAIKRKKYKTDLIPPALIVARWFAVEQAAIEKLQGAQETAARELEEFVEEHSSSGGGEDGLLADAANDRGRVTSAAVKQRLKTIRGEPENDEERAILTRCLALIEAESQAGKAVKEAQAALDRAVLARYATLTEAEIKTLVVEDKWCASIRAAIDDEVQRLTQRLTRRVQELEQRYARPLPALEQEVEVFSAKVERHLKRMGVPQ